MRKIGTFSALYYKYKFFNESQTGEKFNLWFKTIMGTSLYFIELGALGNFSWQLYKSIRDGENASEVFDQTAIAQIVLFLFEYAIAAVFYL